MHKGSVTDLASAAAKRGTKQVVIINQVALTPENQMCDGVIRDTVNEKFAFTRTSGDKQPIGLRTVRTNRDAVRDYAHEHRVSMKAAQRPSRAKRWTCCRGPSRKRWRG